ncbi:MAG TPA: flagellar hook-basal body complex protein FliE [Acidobacteriota bacterium]|nr:flagellar hook-basal body complex protein FliE [Acidobacteriota bacterium]HRR56004.1 flagellar hook-basal body complex protein FliE [Acidobacteriota bacterium]
MNEILLQRTNPLKQLQEFQKQAAKPSGQNGVDFKQLLSEAIREVDQAQKISDQQVEQMISGEIQDVHAAMIALQKADLSFQMMMQVRNKLIDAYQEVMRMQV